ncbi:MAG TPA: hypothetical protein VN847_14855 [Streptosporangiaceae bacterium]|nr:hypothetical protein [Streptosporangiaceae bacterium]
MTLSARQQAVLDQIERALQAADPQLRSMFSIFTRLTSQETMPDAETAGATGVSGRWDDGHAGRSAQSVAGLLVVSIFMAGLFGAFLFSVFGTSNDCPGLSSDQAVVSASVRAAACSHATAAWSKGSR